MTEKEDEKHYKDATSAAVSILGYIDMIKTNATTLDTCYIPMKQAVNRVVESLPQIKSTIANENKHLRQDVRQLRLDKASFMKSNEEMKREVKVKNDKLHELQNDLTLTEDEKLYIVTTELNMNIGMKNEEIKQLKK